MGLNLFMKTLKPNPKDDLEEMDLKCFMADEEVPTNMALMAFSDLEILVSNGWGPQRKLISLSLCARNSTIFFGGLVTFGGGDRGEELRCKGNLKTGMLDFEDMYFVKDLPDESLQVLLKVPRKNNMYSVDMKNIVPKESLNCLVAKKGIKREFSVARNPQQNSVAERRNWTLIEAARTIGRTPALRFMRPFECHVTILNTLDHLAKFEGKSDDGFFVGYSLTSKAFRVTVQSDSHHTTTNAPSTSQPPTSPPFMQTTHVAEQASTLPYDSPLPRVTSLGSKEGSMTLHELTVLCTTLSKKVESLESDLKQTKLTYGAAFTKLIMKVKRLEKEVKLNKARRRAKIVVSDDEDTEKDTSKQGRSMIEDIDQDAEVSLVQIDAEDQGRVEDETDTQILADVARVHTYSRRRRTVSTGGGGISTAEESVSTAGASMPVSIAGMDQGSIPSLSASKDKGKAIMTESEPKQATTKLKQRQEIVGYEATIRLQEQLDEEESQRITRDAEVAQNAEWDDILARVAADEDLVQQLQAGEKYSEEDLPMKLVELVNQRKKFFAQQRTEAKRNKLMTLAQQKTYMSTYIKNQEGGYSIKQLKSLSFEQVKEIFEATMRRVQSFVLMDSELEVQRLKRAGQEVFEETAKRQKIEEASCSGEEQSAEKEKGVKYPIIDWEVYIEESRKYWKIIKVGDHTEAYQTFDDMLKKFDRDDLDKLWSLVKERFSSTDPTDDKERILWIELKKLFEPDIDDILWKLQRYMHDPLTWRLYDTCGVHHVSTDKGHDIFMLVEKDYPLTRGLMTVMLANKLQVDQSSEMANELLRKIFIQAERPRQ
ncbi:retrovirus-related pol polyprotein from transposon 17.6 [Tanacetum coccineum]